MVTSTGPRVMEIILSSEPCHMVVPVPKGIQYFNKVPNQEQVYLVLLVIPTLVD